MPWRKQKEERTVIFILPDAMFMGQDDLILERYKQAGLRVIETKIIMPSRKKIRQVLPSPKGQWGYKTGRKAIEGIRKKGKDPMRVGYRTLNHKIIARAIHKNSQNYYESGPIKVVVLQGFNAIEVAHKLTGGTSPLNARQGTIRHEFSMDSYDDANAGGRPCMKRVHAASNGAEAERQLGWCARVKTYAGKPVFKRELVDWLVASGEKIDPREGVT
jgi:nucleoside diphosphate kinase